MGNKDVARDWLAAVGTGDTERLLSLMTDDGRVHTVGTSVLSADRDLDALVTLVAQLKQFTVDGLHFEFDHFTEEDDRVSVEFTGAAELIDGTRYDNVYHLLFHFRDGKVALVKEYLDTQLVNDTVGPVILRASGAAPPSAGDETSATRDVVQRMYAAAAGGDFDGFFAAVSDDVVVREPGFLPYGGTYTGKEGLRALVGELADRFDLTTLSADYVVADGQRAFALLNVGLAGSAGSLVVAEEALVRDGQVVELRVFVHEGGALVPAGAAGSAGSAAVGEVIGA